MKTLCLGLFGILLQKLTRRLVETYLQQLSPSFPGDVVKCCITNPGNDLLYVDLCKDKVAEKAQLLSE